MGAIGPILFGAKLISDINATRQEYKSQQRAYEAQEAAARQNAAIVDRQRSQQADAYAQKQSQLNDRMKLVRGQAAAAAGAGGFTATGSVNDILDSSYDAYQKDSLNLLSQQRNDSWSAYVNQVNYLNQANAYDSAARQVRKQGHQKIFGTLLGAAATAYGNGWFGGSGSGAGGADTGDLSGLNITPSAYTYEAVPGWSTNTKKNGTKWTGVLNGTGSIFSGGLF
ncbi:MAG: hypothetical protein U0K79_08815 [Phascolarctobacterium sp.]|nr:hypothetical protein [Phascolarctobacterium sp.]